MIHPSKAVSYTHLDVYKRQTLLGVTNLFAASNIDPSNGRISEDGGDSRVRNHAIFANVELGWRSMLYLTLTGRNDWNSRLVNTSEESFFYPSVGLSGIISEMVKLPEFISYLKVRGSYTEVGSPVSQSGLTPGTVTTPIIGGALAVSYTHLDVYKRQFLYEETVVSLLETEISLTCPSYTLLYNCRNTHFE